MSDPVYIIQIGSGLYFDEHGVLHQGAIPPVPSYTLPGGVLSTANDISKFSKTMKDIGDALPRKDPSKIDGGENYVKFVGKLKKLGLPGEDLAKVLGVIGNVAEVAGTVFVVLGVAVAAAKLLGLFNEGPSPLEILIKARFDALDREINALHKLIVENNLNSRKNALGAARSTVSDFVSDRDSLTLTTPEIESRLQTLITNLSLLSAPEWISLLDPITYTVLFDSSQYEKVWPWLSGHLYRVPAGSLPELAVFPAVNTPFFDHRLAVLLAPQAAQTLLMLNRSLSPEFRTTGQLRSTLRDFTDKLSDLAITIRNTSLARTIYTEADFSSPITDFYIIDPFPGLVEPTLKPDYVLVVGAMDLCSHNDAFFTGVVKGFGPPPDQPSRQGSFDFRWRPPARLVRSPLLSGLVHADGTPVILYKITNAKECADAANDQSLQDYSDLLLSSGYLTLVQLAAQMRHATTQPDKSETVTGDVLLQRHPEPATEVTVISNPGPIIFTRTGEIKAQGLRQPQKFRAFASCTTQSIPRAKLIHYRVLLRTLASAVPPGFWREPNYSSVQSTDYINDPLHPGFQRLALSTSFDSILHQEVLMEGTSMIEARHFDRTLSFKAHTFDWWVPIKIPFIGSDSLSLNDYNLHTFLGAASQHAGGLPKPDPEFVFSATNLNSNASPASMILGLGWEDGIQTQGQHREMLETTIQVRVRLDWQGSNIHLKIDENRPNDRNFVIFLVVEETFGSVESDEHAPKVLHTAFPIPINGQITFVPQSLFDQEREATNKQRAFAQKYAVSVRPKLGAPVLGKINLSELNTEAGVARLAATLRQFEPEVLKNITHISQADPGREYSE